MIKEFAKKTIYFYMCMYIGIFCTEKKSLKVSKGDNINFRFYFRDFGCNKGNCTYSDELAIENYVDNSLTVRELSKIALA